MAATRALLQPVDTGPFANIVAVGGTAIEHMFFQPRHHRALDAVLLTVRVSGRKTHIEPGLLEQFFLDANDDRKVEYRIVRRYPDPGHFLSHRNGAFRSRRSATSQYINSSSRPEACGQWFEPV